MNLNQLKANWATSGAAVFAAFFGFVAFKPDLFPAWLQAVAAYAAMGGLAAFGILAKSASVTGTGNAANKP